jgi:8-oxo-dGTP diphosphatase
MYMKITKNSVAFVIYSIDRKNILAVQRPANDENLPNVWGLPAGSLKENEPFEDAVLRAGIEKLGVKLRIEKEIGEDTIERSDYTLFMKEFETSIIEGQPKVPQPVAGITQYQNWKWALPQDLSDGAKKGSLCSRIYLESINRTL